jgi:glucarate dehydratase
MDPLMTLTRLPMPAITDVDFDLIYGGRIMPVNAGIGLNTDPEATGWAAARQVAARDTGGVVTPARATIDAYGFASVRREAGDLEPDLEADATLALRQAPGAGHALANRPQWGLDLRRRIAAGGRRLQGMLEYCEDHVRGDEAIAARRRELDVPFATSMCTTSYGDIPGSIVRHSENTILADHHFWGGLRATHELSRIATTFGRGLSTHSNSHVGISMAAMTYLAAAMPTLTHACDMHCPWPSDELLTGGKLPIEGGCPRLTRESGLGVTLDAEALARLHQACLDCGLVDRDGAAEMRKKEPDWAFMPVRY